MNRNLHDVSPAPRGYTLATVLFILVLLGSAVLLVVALAGTSFRRVMVRRDSLAALYAAESGVNEALWRLNPVSSGVPGYTFRTYEPGDTNPSFSLSLNDRTSYRVWVQKTDASHATVWALGRRGAAARLVRVQADLGSFGNHIVVYRTKDFRHNVALTYRTGDSAANGPLQASTLPPLNLPDDVWSLWTYSSSPYSGDYTVQNNQVLSDNLVAQGNITIRNNCRITGDVVAGGSVTIENNTRVTGDVISLTGSVAISQNVTVTGSVLAREGSVTIENNAAVTGLVYVGDSDGLLTVQNNAALTGLAYSVNDVHIENNAQVAGAIIGDHVTAHNNVRLVFDFEKVTVLDLLAGSFIRPTDWREGFR